MTLLRIPVLLDTVKIYLLAGLTLSLSLVHAQPCELRIARAVTKIKDYTTHNDRIYDLVPYIQDPDNTGAVKRFCDTYPQVGAELLSIKADCAGSGEIPVNLAKLAGYDFMCNTGHGDYGKYSKCIHDMTAKLSKTCTIQYDTLTELRKQSIYAGPDTHGSLCTAIEKYIQCSHRVVSEGCGGQEAGNWYRSFMKSVFSKLVDETLLSCSFGASTGILNNNVTTIAIFVGVGVFVLLLLFCFCWCCRAGVCSCCKEDEDEDIKYHMPDNNDNEKDLSGVNSVV